MPAATTSNSPAVQGFLFGLNAVGQPYGAAEEILRLSDEHRVYPLVNAITRAAFLPMLAPAKPALAVALKQNYASGKLELLWGDSREQALLKTMALTTIMAPYRALPSGGALGNLSAIANYGTTAVALASRFIRDYPNPPEGIYYALGECAGRAVGLTRNPSLIATALRSIVAGE